MEAEFDLSKAGYWKKQYQDARETAKLQAQIVNKINSLKAWGEGTYHKAAEFNDDRFKDATKMIKEITYRGMLSLYQL